MRASFNVLDQGWIPVVDLGGSRRLLGIRETLFRAHELREISDPSPLEEYSVYRFLGLFLMDALRPAKLSGIRALLRDGRFDEATIERYIGQCRSEGVSFDLFDEERPFLQSVFITDQEKIETSNASRLDFSIPRESGHTHFEHRPIDMIKYSPDKAARLLLARYVFCLSEGKGYYYSVYGEPPYFGVIKGSSLFQTLAATLLPLDSNIVQPFDSCPVLWRNKDLVVSSRKREVVSWLQGMLFPARKIQLIPDTDGMVSTIYYATGEKCENIDCWRDPFVTRSGENANMVPIVPKENDAIWRNICDIAGIEGDTASPLLHLYKRLHPAETIHMTLYGILSKKGKIQSVYRYDLDLPSILTEQAPNDLLKGFIAYIHQLKKALHNVFFVKRDGKNEEIMPSMIRVCAEMRFDEECEGMIWNLCEEIKTADSYNELIEEFKKEAVSMVRKAFEEAINSVSLSGERLKRIEKIRSEMEQSILKINYYR